MAEFEVSQEIATLGLSLFVLGWAVGPLIWAPMSELYGRQYVYFVTLGVLAFFNAGTAGAQNVETVLVLRFLGGCFGASPFTNAAGVIADMFAARERGLAMSLFSAAPFMGPGSSVFVGVVASSSANNTTAVLGPIVGGFIGESVGWRWIEGVMAILSGVVWVLGTFAAPETYAPVLLKRRAAKLSQMTGMVYLSKAEKDRGPTTLGRVLQTNLLRPWVLLFREPIVFLLSLYMAVIYGTLYMLFGAYPIVYREQRGWSAGVAGLPFIGVAIGMLASVVYNVFIENPRYLRNVDKGGGVTIPEDRLPPCLVGAVALPIGLFWFAWTNSPSLPWAASTAAGIPFGFAMVLVFLSVMNYLIDSYTIYAASVLAANSVLRCIFGFAFPLFTTQMYAGLGIHWASTVPALLAVVCLPFPFLFYRYGHVVRKRSKFAREAAEFARGLREKATTSDESDEVTKDEE
ncbi:Efflux pump FUBT [Lasiodiplodia theobromae]|uniref:Efflux pump FUBT n=2 Tax=Lasiodiplodia theobromae TaxID=45133 RepID=A0A5N5D3P3_9PEZI|nr:Efflux pump FUBT [Lasiodiplodia theobromae]